MTLDLTALFTSVIGTGLSIWAVIKVMPASYIEKLLGHYLDARLTRVKNDHDREMEQIRSQLAHLSDRGKRSNEREFEALMAVWEHFVEAYHSTLTCIMSLIQLPDLAHMQEADLRAFLEQTKFDARLREDIITSENRNAKYARLKEIEMINDAGEKIVKARSMVRRQSVFIPSALNVQLEEAIKQLQHAQSERRVEIQMTQPLPTRTGDRLIAGGGDKLFDELRDTIRTRLMPDETKKA